MTLDGLGMTLGVACRTTSDTCGVIDRAARRGSFYSSFSR